MKKKTFRSLKQTESFAKAFTERGYIVTTKTFKTVKPSKIQLAAHLIRLIRKYGISLHDAIIIVYGKKISVQRKSKAKHN